MPTTKTKTKTMETGLPPTLVRWLLTQTDRDDPVGDLARDLAADPRGQRKASYNGLLRYLKSVDACDGAITALERAQRLYLRFLETSA